MTSVGDLLAEYKEMPSAESTAPVLTLTEKNGFVRQSERFHKRLATDDTSKYKVVRRNDIAFNPYLLWAGAVAQNTIVDEGIISPLYPTFKVREGHDPRYVARLLLAPQMIAAYDTIAFGSVPRRRRSSVENFLNLPVPEPPSAEEQQRVASILDKASEVADKQGAVLSKLDVLAQAIFRDLFGEPSTWPRRWPMGRIGDMAEDVQYGTSEKAGDSGEWPIVRMGNVTDTGRLDLTDLKWIDLTDSDIVKYTLKPGDLLFNRTNSKERVGKTCVVTVDQPLAFAGYLVRVRLKPQHRPEFVNAFMTSRYGQALRRSMAKAAVNQANINASEMQSIPIALPPTNLQVKFAEAVEDITAQRLRQLGAIAKAQDLLTALQARAFSGQL
ncbi:MAG: restriction endonuclease subunit S [Mycobacterium sp.]